MAAYIDANGDTQQVEVGLDLVKEAKDAAMSERDFINAKFETDPAKYGDAFSQLCESEGIVLVPNKAHGLKTSKLDAVLNGRPILEAGAIVRTPTSQARVLLMPAIGALVEDKLVADLDLNANAFESMLALDETIADEWLLWPEINYSGPEAARSQVVSQLAKPTNMLSITTAEKSVRIPTFALGIEWSEQATKYVNLDLLTLAIARQAAIERNARANANLLNIVAGDADMGQGTLTSLSKVTTAVSLDPAASTGITQAAWVKWLYLDSTKEKITHIVTDIAGALAIENRSGRPVVTNDNPTSNRIDTTVRVANPSWAPELPIFIVDPSVGWTAGTILGIDKRYALHRVTSSSASYSAQEDFVLRRGSAMRFDFGQIVRRLFADASGCKVLTYA